MDVYNFLMNLEFLKKEGHIKDFKVQYQDFEVLIYDLLINKTPEKINFKFNVKDNSICIQ